MAKYRKKPVVIEAVQFQGVGWYEEHNKPYPKGLCQCAEGSKRATGDPYQTSHTHIHTEEGVMLVAAGDWIITGVEGEHYPCKPSVFVTTYEPVND